MIIAVLTAFCFALSAVTGQRSAVRYGAIRGNMLRLLIAAAILAVVVLLAWPESIRRETFGWFFLSGLIGFGLGDVGLFLAYERLGSRLTILLNLCLAPLFAMALEWVWLGNGLTPPVFFCALLILTGVVLAIRPRAHFRQRMERRGSFGFGIVAAVTAGFGQGTGAVISRRAEVMAVELGISINGISAAFQRVLAGLVFALVVCWLVGWAGRIRRQPRPRASFDFSQAHWLLGAALFGPVIGVSCFQWALRSLESGIVLAVVATTPIIMMPLASLTEGDHPTRLAIFGALVAVTGVILLYLWS